jgi:hypothetical protein
MTLLNPENDLCRVTARVEVPPMIRIFIFYPFPGSIRHL